MSGQDEIKKLISYHKRRLQELEKQRAIEGRSADPKIPIEIEDIKAKIKKLQTELEAIEERPEPPPQSIPADSKESYPQMRSPSASFIHGRPVPASHFIGRRRAVDQVLSQLANPARGSTAIAGDPRVGKTSLLHYLCEAPVHETWGLAPSRCHFLYLDCHSIIPFNEAVFWRYLLRELALYLNDDQALSQRIQQLLAQASPDMFDLYNLFDQVARAGRLVILLLDEFEGVVENLDPGSTGLLYHLRALLNRRERGLALVVASRESLQQLCAGFHFTGSPFDNAFSALTLLPFSDAEVDELLSRSQVDFSATERVYLRQMAGLHPYLLQVAAALMVQRRGEPAKGELAAVQIDADFERATEGYFLDVLKYANEREQMLLAFVALGQFSPQLPAGSTGLEDLSDLFERYDHEKIGLVTRGLIFDRPDGPELFSPILGRWVLRRVILEKGGEALSRWEPHYADFLSSSQKKALENLVGYLIRWPAIIKTPELLARMLEKKKPAWPPTGVGSKILGRYAIKELIGRGATADVFKAHDLHLDRLVAIKKLRASLTETDEAQARFRREAKVIAGLRHPHIAQVYDLDAQGDHYYIIMQYVEGQDLERYLRSLKASGQNLAMAEILRIAAGVAGALDCAHQSRMIHRDIKPANILLTNEGGVFLTDFGLVQLLGQTDLIESGSAVGTPAYIAPEQIEGDPGEIDHRADIYAFGCVVYEMVTGHPPFKLSDLPMAHFTMEPLAPNLIVPDLPEVAGQIILKALAKEAGERPASASQFVQDLSRAFKAYRPIRLGGTVFLPDDCRAVIKQLYAETSQPGIVEVDIHKNFQGGLSPAQVILTQPIDDKGRGMAREVVKIGPRAMLHREFDRYNRFIRGRLPMTAANLERGPVELGDLACLSYSFVGDQPFGLVQDLETYYLGHSAAEVEKVLAGLLKPLDARWYGQHEPLNVSFADEYGRQLPAHLRLLAERISAGEELASGSARLVDVATILEAEQEIEISERIVIPDLEVSQVEPGAVKLRSSRDGPKVWITVKVKSPLPTLREGDRVSVQGIVETRRDDVLHHAATNILHFCPAITRRPKGALDLEGLPAPYPDPVALYRPALAQQLDGRKSIIHGDLHPGNILVDESGRAWLIDFYHIREGHILFDFIKLETLLRLFALGGVRRPQPEQTISSPASQSVSPSVWPYEFSLAEYAALETALIQQTLGRPPEAIDNANLNHAFEVISAIRHLAQPYLRSPDRWNEYLIGLFLHNLAQLKFYENSPHLGILPFTTAMVAGREISELAGW